MSKERIDVGEEHLCGELPNHPGEEVDVMDTAVVKHPARGPENTPIKSTKGHRRQNWFI